jgi:hypothetical protein
MIFEPNDTDAQKVFKVREHYAAMLAKNVDERGAMQKSHAFRHGQQWTEEQKDKLNAEGRPALTFNLVAPTTRELIGANEDQRREPRAAPVGVDALPTSEVVNHLWKRIYEQQDVESTEGSAFENGITGGIGYTFMDAHPSEQNPNEIEVTFDDVPIGDVVRDPDACKPNMEDASFFYWARWMSESDYKEHYPDQSKSFDDLLKEAEGSADSVQGALSTLDAQYAGKYYVVGLSDVTYFDRKSRKLKILHLEYKVPERRYYVMDPRKDERGAARGFVRVSKSSYDKVKASGAAETHSSMGTAWRWFECTGAQVLFDAAQPLPIYCPQLLAFTCYYDTVQCQYYGIVRDLEDPQMEYNKRVSQELNLQSQSAQPGLIYDQGAFPGKTPTQVERKVKTPGFALEKMPGKEYAFREAPQIPAGADRMAERAQSLVQMISGIDLNPLLGGQPDQVAVGTAMLSHRKGLLAITPIMKNFRKYQQKLLSSVVELIMKSFPDEQIEAMLSDSEKVKVQDGVVVDAESQSQVSIRELRTVRWNIEMESAAANTTQQMMMFSLLMSMKGAGIAVDPDVFFSYFPGSRDEQQKLVTYLKAAEQAQAQAAQMQAQAAAKQVENVITVEGMKVQQRSEEAKIDAAVEIAGQKQDLLTEIIKLFAQAGLQKEKLNIDKVNAAIDAARAKTEAFDVGARAGTSARGASVYEREAAAAAEQPEAA